METHSTCIFNSVHGNLTTLFVYFMSTMSSATSQTSLVGKFLNIHMKICRQFDGNLASEFMRKKEKVHVTSSLVPCIVSIIYRPSIDRLKRSTSR
jgi:hypothetical protein